VAAWTGTGALVERISAEARAIAEDAGLLYVEDRCLVIEQRRLGLEAPHP